MTPKSLIAPARLARRPVLATQTDARLVDLVRAGYEPAFEAIVSRYRGALLRYVEGFLSRERAEDAVQQSFVSAYEAMLRDDAELNLRPWLYRIAHNAALNVLRDRGLRHEALDERLDGVERPDQALDRSQRLRELVAAVKALPERQREAIVLRELEGRSYDEIANSMGVSDGSVRQLLNRARHTLRAGATAVMPVGLVLRIPWAAPAEPLGARVAELCGAGAAGALATKVCATAFVTGAVAGGVAVAPAVVEDGARADQSPSSAAKAGAGRAAAGDRLGSRAPPASLPAIRSEAVAAPRPSDRGSERGRSGPRDREVGAMDDNSGPGGGGSSGSGSGSSGSGSSGSGSGGSGSGSGSSRSGSDGSDSSGSGSSGSGPSGGGSGGSGSSGSGSGRGSSGSGSSGGSSGSSEPEAATATETTELTGDSGSSGFGSSGSGSGGSGSGDSASNSGSGDSSGPG